MKTIPLTDTGAQIVSVTLGGQACRIEVYQRRTGLFLDLYRDDTLVIGGAACRDRVRVLRDAYHQFDGDLAFEDTQGTDDPTTPGLGSRFVLLYLEVADLADYV